MIAKSLSIAFLSGRVPLAILAILAVMRYRRSKMIRSRWPFSGMKNREGIAEYDISASAFDPSLRKPGVSFFARLKNGADFLEVSVRSHLPFATEIVLVDNGSTDSTVEICERLAAEYPEKIRFYRYEPKVVGVGSADWKNTPDDSVHALSYYYNWTLSKTTCTHAAKLDDDMVVFDPEAFARALGEAMKSPKEKLTVLPQINVALVDGNVMTPVRALSPFLPPVAGIYLDHGVFPVSERTYFVNDVRMETFLFDLPLDVKSACLFHLKGMKHDSGTRNWAGDMAKLVRAQRSGSQYVPLPEELKSSLRKWIPSVR